MAWGSNNRGWWGEGEIKFYMDGDDDFPTICGTGTEDISAARGASPNAGGPYQPYSTPYLGLPQVIQPDGFYQSQQRFGMYRWHIQDPIRFEQDLRVTIQALGWRSGSNARRRFRRVALPAAARRYRLDCLLVSSRAACALP